MIFSMDMNQIAYFLDIAETGNMTRTSERLHVAQPSISRSMSRLEQELGCTLFTRAGRGITLTPEGTNLAKRLAPVAAELHDIEGMFRENPQQKTISIRVSAASEVACSAIATWLEQPTADRVSLTQGANPDRDIIDIDISDAPKPPVAQQAWFSERIMVATANPELFARSQVSFGQLTGLPFISLPSTYGFSSSVQKMCLQEGFRPDNVFTSNNPSVVRKMISLGLGVGFWPERSWGDPAEHGVTLLPLQREYSRKVCVSLTLQGSRKTQATACYELIASHFAQVFQ